jgi:hypothetical protein
MWRQFYEQFVLGMSTILPWFAGGALAVVVVSLTPFGQALTRYLRDVRRVIDAPPELLDELTMLRRDVADILQRLDGIEGIMTRDRLPGSAPGAGGPELPTRSSGKPVTTPH